MFRNAEQATIKNHSLFEKICGYAGQVIGVGLGYTLICLGINNFSSATLPSGGKVLTNLSGVTLSSLYVDENDIPSHIIMKNSFLPGSTRTALIDRDKDGKVDEIQVDSVGNLFERQLFLSLNRDEAQGRLSRLESFKAADEIFSNTLLKFKDRL